MAYRKWKRCGQTDEDIGKSAFLREEIKYFRNNQNRRLGSLDGLEKRQTSEGNEAGVGGEEK